MAYHTTTIVYDKRFFLESEAGISEFMIIKKSRTFGIVFSPDYATILQIDQN